LEAALGATHLEVAGALNNMAVVYTQQARYISISMQPQRSVCHSDASMPSAALRCRYSAALPIYLRALRIYEAKLGNMEGHDSDEHVQATLPCTQQSGITLTTLAHAHAVCRSQLSVADCCRLSRSTHTGPA
jgi:hypothetical protein